MNEVSKNTSHDFYHLCINKGKTISQNIRFCLSKYIYCFGRSSDCVQNLYSYIIIGFRLIHNVVSKCEQKLCIQTNGQGGPYIPGYIMNRNTGFIFSIIYQQNATRHNCEIRILIKSMYFIGNFYRNAVIFHNHKSMKMFIKCCNN